MIDLMWPPWVQIVAGGLGSLWAWSNLNHIRDRGRNGPLDVFTAWGLLLSSAILGIVGVVRGMI